MRRFILALSFLMFVSQSAFAEELVPATSEDLQEFDQQVSKSNAEDSKAKEMAQRSIDPRKDAALSMKEKKARKENFGAVVSTEAKKLRDESVDKRKEMGSWVSSQRRKSGQEEAGSGEQHGNSGAAASSRDSRDSSPANNDHGGGSSSEHGNSGNHKK